MSASADARQRSEPPAFSISGVILAGGQGRRMGGADKALQPLAGQPLLAWVAQRFAPQVTEWLINASDAPAYLSFGARVVADEFPGAGPLAGMHAALKAARHEWLATVPCDAPFLPADLVARLSKAAAQDGAALAVARTADGRQPVFALLHRSLLQPLENYLASGGRKADGWYAGVRFVEVEFTDTAAFANINTAEQLQQAGQALKETREP